MRRRRPRMLAHRLALAMTLSGLPALPLPADSADVPATPRSQEVLTPRDAAGDLGERLARWKRVEMPFDASALSEREQSLVLALVDACRDLEDIYWRQTDPQAIDLYHTLERTATQRDRDLRRLLWINGSRWDLLDENRPFVGASPMPPGHALYPPGLRRPELEAWVKAHPEQTKAIFAERTLVRRDAAGELAAIPYHEAYRAFLEPAAAALRRAAGLAEDPAFARFLALRAEALLTDDYFPSDVAWVSLEHPKFDLIFAPYETYLDNLLGVKTSYGAAVLVRNEAESAKLAVFQKYVPEIQEALPLPAADLPSKRGKAAPMEVMDAPFRAGDLRHGYQAVADNLPNDPRIHERYGSKRIFFKNFMDARVRWVILPVAERLLRPDQAAKVSGEGYLAAVMMHEVSHGLGPAFARVGGEKVDIREAIGGAYSGLEEAKADVTGMFGLKWLVDRGALPAARLEEYYASYVAGIFRTVRFGTGEAHGRAEMMEFNVLSEKGAITRDAASGTYAVDFAKMPAAIASLTKELLEIEATGDRERAERWFARYDAMPPDLQRALAATGDIPVDLDPVFTFAEGIR